MYQINMTQKEDPKILTLKDKHAIIMKTFNSLENSVVGKNNYNGAVRFWEDLHELGEMIKDFFKHFFSIQKPAERFRNISMYNDVVSIDLKIRLS